jgi:hypothetical protein
MGNNKYNRITLITVTVISLFTGSIIMAPPQLVDSLSIYNPDATSPGPNDMTKSTPTTTPTLPSIPPAECAMDTIESLQTFLSCLGAK